MSRTPLDTTTPSAATLRRSALVRVIAVLVGLAVLVVLGVISISFGVRTVTLDDIVAGIGGATDTVEQAAIAKRVPRTVLALLVGGALAISGATMQAVTRNPIADPGILGVSSGASLAVVIGIAFFQMSNSWLYVLVAIGGGMLAAVFVYAVGSLGRGGATPLKLALAGAATTAAFSSLVSAVLLPRVNVLTSFQSWQIGGVGGADWPRLSVLGPVLALGALICFLCARGMNSLALGDDIAAGLGERVFRTRLVSAVGAVILAGAATAIAGPIGFVGLVVPHVCRLLMGTDHRWLLPFSALVGAALLTASDVLGRLITQPDEMQVGIVTAVVGAPIFIWIVRRQKVREL